ncbi:MAG: RNB domain-containing ribonuclease [Candidatus Lambdaproteobacteria bacterium]|nr:RNB domain-containing ribonuclease [Candidatus Lambdaproteobacteria bacterium]
MSSAIQFALLYQRQTLVCAWVVSREVRPWLLELADGERLTAHPNRLLHTWQAEAEAGAAPRDVLARHERDWPALGEALAATAAARLPAEQPLAFAQAARAVLGDAADPWAQANLLRAMLSDRRRFRHEGGAGHSFVRRGAEALRAHDAAAAEEAARAAWLERALAWCEAAQRGATPPPCPQGLAEALESLLAEQRQSPHWATLAKPLRLTAARQEELQLTLQRLLVTAGAWGDWPRIWLRAAGVSPAFDPAVLEAARREAERPVSTAGRRDETAWVTYTIDAARTFDYDDAFSIVETRAGGLLVAVHIAEPFPDWAPGHVLFDEAARRISSVYTDDAIYPMLPESLSHGRLSLVRGQPREALTFLLRIDGGPGELVELRRGVVAVADNLAYDAAERLIAAQPDTWGRLAVLCDEMRRWRRAHGAMVAEARDVSVDCSDPAHLALIERNRDESASRVVEELSIATNRVSGAYCRREGLPALYRVQRPPSRTAAGRSAQREGTRSGAASGAARFSLQGGPHMGLACERYVQTTSPIRRFADLVMQRQIAEHAVAGRMTYTDTAQLKGWLERAEERMGAYAEAERRSAEHWKRRYLAQHPGLIVPGEVREIHDDGGARIWLTGLQMAVEGRLPSGASSGEVFRFEVQSVDEDRQQVQVRPAP